MLFSDLALNLLQRMCFGDERKLLLMFCKKGLDILLGTSEVELKALPFFTHSDIRGECILPVLQEFGKFTALVFTLLNVEVKRQDASAVTFYQNYQHGPSTSARTVRALLRNPNPDTQEERFLADAVADVLRTAASVKTLRPKMDELTAKLEAENPEVQHLLEASQLLPNFKSGLRQGEAKNFSALLVDKLVEYVDKLTSHQDGVEKVSTKSIALLRETMQPFEKDSKVLACQGKLMKFLTSHNKSIALTDLLEWARSVCENSRSAKPAPLINATELKDILTKCGTGVGSVAGQELREVGAVAIRIGIQEVLEEAFGKGRGGKV